MSYSTLVSIVIPAYKTTWFKECFHSAVDQDYQNLEIIVGDDSAGDEIKEIVDRLSGNRKVTYLKNTPSLGEIENLLKCFDIAQGKYIKILYDDDVMRQDCVSRLLSAMEENPQVVIATSRRNRIDEKGKVLPDNIEYVSPFFEDTLIKGEGLATFQADNRINFIGEPSTVLLKTEIVHTLRAEPDGLFSLKGELMNFFGDMTLYVKMSRLGDIAYINDTLSSFRISREQESQRSREAPEIAAKTHQLFPALVRELRWYTNTSENPCNTLNIAPLSSPEAITCCDIKTNLKNAFDEQKLHEWLEVRSLLPVQKKLIEQYLLEKELHTTVGVFILGSDDKSIAVTLNSLQACSYSGISLQAIVIGENVAKERQANTCWKNAGEHEIVSVINHTLSVEGFDWVCIIRAGEEFIASGLTILATALAEAEGLHALYGDEIFYIKDRMTGACFRPDFNLDMFLSTPSTMASHWLMRGETVLALNGFDDHFHHCWEFDYLIRLIEAQGIAGIGHFAEPLVKSRNKLINFQNEEKEILQRHLINRGYPKGRVEYTDLGYYRLHYGHESTPLVSIVIDGLVELSQLITCVTTLMDKTKYLHYQLIIVQESTNDNTVMAEWLDSLSKIDPGRIDVVKVNAMSRADARNISTQAARGEYLLFLDSQLAIIDDAWLDNLLNHGLRPEVGIAGGKIINKDNTIHHAGYIVGLKGAATSPFIDESNEKHGHMGRLQLDQNYSAVSGQCLLIKRAVFDEVGGFDTQLNKFEDVDLALRIREFGYFTVWTPYCKLLKTEPVEKEKNKINEEAEEDKFFQRWLSYTARDPAYNANLSLGNAYFTMNGESEISWKPLSWRPLPVVMPHMADEAGCGYYRIIKPFEAMQREGLVDGKLSALMLNLPLLEQYKPDSIILQRQTETLFHDWIRRVGKLSGVFKVLELDDYLPNLPVKNHHRIHFSKDIMRRIRRSLDLVDRFVVSTEPLAEAFKEFHSDIVVVKNRLPEEWWGNLKSLRQQGKKPRIGWAGGSSHTGDLEMMASVIREFANDVEWVFFGMCPPIIKPYLHEYHHGVNIHLYPAKLASLNLDLALAPVEDNFFNTCKSNLRLMEYGACGIPVICSDVECYRGDLPVTRVRNRFLDWRDAIRMHLADPDASHKMGLALQKEIRENWMLKGEHLVNWRKAWLPD